MPACRRPRTKRPDIRAPGLRHKAFIIIMHKAEPKNDMIRGVYQAMAEPIFVHNGPRRILDFVGKVIRGTKVESCAVVSFCAPS